MKSILALDLSSETGWAVRRPSGAIETGVALFLKTNIPGRRWERFFKWLNDMIAFENPDLIVFESPFIHMKHASGLGTSYGFSTIVDLVAAQHEIRCYSVTPSELKKWATGSGNADKSKMLTYARSMGWNLSNDNEIDARWLLHYAAERMARAQKAVARSATGNT